MLNNTSSKTRRTYISRELRSLNVPYIANIDFGSKYDREHYHGIAQIDWIDRETYELGGIHVQRVNTNNPLALAKYINKLTNHALKDSTGCARLLYSRQKRRFNMRFYVVFYKEKIIKGKTRLATLIDNCLQVFTQDGYYYFVTKNDYKRYRINEVLGLYLVN